MGGGEAVSYTHLDVYKRQSLLTLSAIKYRLEDILKTDVDVIHGPLTPDSMIVIDRKVPLYES